MNKKVLTQITLSIICLVIVLVYSFVNEISVFDVIIVAIIGICIAIQIISYFVKINKDK